MDFHYEHIIREKNDDIKINNLIQLCFYAIVFMENKNFEIFVEVIKIYKLKKLKL